MGRGFFWSGLCKPSPEEKPSHMWAGILMKEKNDEGMVGQTFPGVLLGHLVSLCVLFQYVAFSLVCETSFLVYVI